MRSSVNCPYCDKDIKILKSELKIGQKMSVVSIEERGI